MSQAYLGIFGLGFTMILVCSRLLWFSIQIIFLLCCILLYLLCCCMLPRKCNERSCHRSCDLWRIAERQFGTGHRSRGLESPHGGKVCPGVCHYSRRPVLPGFWGGALRVIRLTQLRLCFFLLFCQLQGYWSSSPTSAWEKHRRFCASELTRCLRLTFRE